MVINKIKISNFKTSFNIRKVKIKVIIRVVTSKGHTAKKKIPRTMARKKKYYRRSYSRKKTKMNIHINKSVIIPLKIQFKIINLQFNLLIVQSQEQKQINKKSFIIWESKGVQTLKMNANLILINTFYIQKVLKIIQFISKVLNF